MCGIVGIAGNHDPAWVERMNRMITHRGPDDHGEYRSPQGPVTLAMRRLSILDVQHGHQPLSNQDGTVWIVYNGEVYNAPEIRERLEKRGHRFATTNSDTEVLVHLYEDAGPSMVDELNGMFAFVIHDQKRNLLFGARDRVGIKPLYYWNSGGRFAFASELKSLLALPFVERQIDDQSLADYMALLYVPDGASIIKGVCRIPPGHHFTYDFQTQSLSLKQYWRLGFEGTEPCEEQERPAFLRAELRDAVKRWSLSDVPIACSLSGGLDSSAIVGLLSESGYPNISTYTLGFKGEEEESWNEMHLARQVASRWGTRHHEIVLEPQDLLSDLIQMVWHLDEPYGGGLPSWYVFREMSKDVKVALTGTGGDELFGNYGKFRIYERGLARASIALRQWSPMSSDLVSTCMRALASVSEHLPDTWRWIGRGHLLSELPDIVSNPFGHFYTTNFDYSSMDRFKPSLMVRERNGGLRSTSSYLQNLYEDSHAMDLRNGLAAVDFRTQLAEEFLFMTDRFSMAHSLEARVPFLDHTLIEKVFRIPSFARTRQNDLKYLFKQAVGDLVPPELLSQRKRGFVIPLQIWLRRELRPLVEQLLEPERLRKQGLFQPSFYESFVRAHLENKRDYTWRIWGALMFQLWHVVFIEQKEIEIPTYSWQAI
jgi:asparagine synthase (glutamine-hydrolysing)